MVENNLVEMTIIRKRQVIGEIIKNTELCCLIWSETGQPRQYTATATTNILLLREKEYTFYISKINSGIYLDVITNCKRFVTYNSNSFSDVETLYQIIEGIADRRTNNIGETLQNLQNVPPQCGILFSEYTRGGIVTGGYSEEIWVNKAREGGVTIGGHSPYNQKAIPEGGAVLGGEARINPIIEFPEGGVVVGGETTPRQFIEISGGVVIGGNILFESTMLTSGGNFVGGKENLEIYYNVDTTGGSKIGGQATVSQ